MKEIFQIVYDTTEENPNDVHWLWKEESEAMKSMGVLVDTKPLPEATRLMYRGSIISLEENYPNDERYIHNYEINENYLFLSKYYPFISDLSIETYFFDDLNDETVNKIKELGWEKAFIKKDIKALEHYDDNKSIYPLTSFEEMKKLYAKANTPGKYAVRKYIEKGRLENELRYWVFNGNIYRRDDIIPDIVKEAVQRLNKLGGKYYTIDATLEFIVEVNPGESSDRHAENSAELFASWIKNEFDNF
jgi:hypothetical protein